MLIYYFETKDALLGEVLHTIAANFTGQLDALLGQHQRSGETLRTELLTLSSSPQYLPQNLHNFYTTSPENGCCRPFSTNCRLYSCLFKGAKGYNLHATKIFAYSCGEHF